MTIEVKVADVFGGTVKQITGLVDGREIIVLQGTVKDGFRVISSGGLPVDFAKASAMVECMHHAVARANELCNGGKQPVSTLTFNDLWPGDQFTAVGALWTKLDHETARKHSRESVALDAKGAGYGYIGDSICSFERTDPVVFVPVNQPKE